MSLDEIETDAAGAEPAGSAQTVPACDKLLDMHRTMVRIRQFEERVKTDYLARKMPGFTHSYVGEEAVAAGGCARARAGRPDHLDAPRPWACHREGRGLGR